MNDTIDMRIVRWRQAGNNTGDSIFTRRCDLNNEFQVCRWLHEVLDHLLYRLFLSDGWGEVSNEEEYILKFYIRSQINHTLRTILQILEEFQLG